ncbi:RnfABCDGE type electron transport complex subunit D [Nocardiopsis sp. RV163]|uniref:RnfABCDGE type electron transport complex subunit D n=1 Tax=Nocardiopsis sp. RV163 TaxID=1661388 RepID=UPI00064C02C5|nr:RnfABCDGE type electron transport complex subunit D [Nocardiopsis sp. RV163]
MDRRVKALRMFATSITVFTIVGHFLLGFEQSPVTPIAAVLFGYVLDLALETLDARAAGRRPQYTGGAGAMVDYLLPTHIAGLACAMLLWGNASLWPYLFAVSIAVSSKYVFRIRVGGRRRHFLNPSNLGIAVTLLLFPWVGIAPPYHFTNNTFGTVDWLIPLGILMAGTMLNVNLTKRWPLILGWVGGFVLQAVLRWLVLDHMLLAALMPLTGVAFILFTNYMITDPGTTPSKPRNQMVFGLTVAVVYGVLVSAHVVFGLFFALVITCALRGLVLVCAPWFTGAGPSSAAPAAPDARRVADR